jgi:hypothetical protein
MAKKRDSTTKLLDDIIGANSALMKDNKVDDDTKFKAQDRVLKALAMKERMTKKSGTKFDLT